MTRTLASSSFRKECARNLSGSAASFLHLRWLPGRFLRFERGRQRSSRTRIQPPRALEDSIFLSSSHSRGRMSSASVALLAEARSGGGSDGGSYGSGFADEEAGLVNVSGPFQFQTGSSGPKGGWWRTKTSVRVTRKEAVGLALVTAAASGLLGNFTHSFIYGGIGAGAVVLAWFSARLILESINRKRMEQSVKDWENVLNEMSSILAAVEEKSELASLKRNFVFYLALARIAHRTRLKRLEVEGPGMVPMKLSHSEIRELHRAGKLAFSTYGPLLILLGMADANIGVSTREIVKQFTQLREKDIISMELDGGVPLCPRHFITYDHDAKSVVVCLRGTLTLSDAITDLLCRSYECFGGFAHYGMMHGANVLWATHKETITSALQKNPGYSLTITGHSLGGGTAALLLLKLMLEPREQNSLPENVDVRAIAFSSPPVFEPMDVIPDFVHDALTVVQYRDDCVPSLSLASVTSLLHNFKKIDELGYDLPAILKMIAEDKVPEDVIAAFERGTQDMENFAPLGVPGKVIWIWSATDCRRLIDKGVCTTLSITDNMVTNHFPNNYDKILTEMLESTRP